MKQPGGHRAFRVFTVALLVGLVFVAGMVVVTKVAPLLIYTNKGKIRSDLRAICEASVQFHAATGRFPADIDEMIRPVDEAGNELWGTCRGRPRDPWRNEYLYELRDGFPVARSLGRDGLPGGEGDDADLEETARLTARERSTRNQVASE